MQRDSRLIYPEVHAPDDHFDQMRRNPQIYEEDPVSDRSSAHLNTTQSFDSESGIVEQPQESGCNQQSDDLCAESLTEKKAILQKWQRKHRRCSLALLILACVFMACSSFHLLFPPRFDKMMKHGGRDPHEKHAEPRFADEEDHHRRRGDHDGDDEEFRGGRHHGGRHLRNHDEEFFVVKKSVEFEGDYAAPSYTFQDDKHHERRGGDRDHHDGEHRNDGGEYKVDKKVLQERRLTRLMSRASFVSFLMWLFIAIAAVIGLKAARQTENSKWFMRCSFRKSIIFIVLASLLGIWKLFLDKKLMKQFHRFEKELEETGNFGKKHHNEEYRQNRENGRDGKKHHGGRKDRFGRDEDDLEWSFNEIKQMSLQEQDQMINDLIDKQMAIVFGRRDQRHLSSAPEGRRLRSAFDVFDFVNNAISSGVKQAKHTQKDILTVAEKVVEPAAKKILKQSAKDVVKAEQKIDLALGEIVQDINKAIHKNDKKHDEEKSIEEEIVVTSESPTSEVIVESTTPVVEMAPPTPPVDYVNACGKDEALNILGSNKCSQDSECDGMRTCSSYGWCQGVSGCDAAPVQEEVVEVVEPEPIPEEVVEIEIMEEELKPEPATIEEPIEEPILEVVEEEEEELDLFTVEETEAIKALAEMGRVFDDEDEARLVKLTEDLTTWINKYAPTFDDPESLLFEVTSSLVTEEMQQEQEEPVAPEIFEQGSVGGITITFSFGDNQDWFVFEQTMMPQQQQQEFYVEYDFDFDNVWAEMTKDLNQWDDWSRLNDDDWNSLIEFQYLEDTDIDNIIDEFMIQEYDPEFKSFIDSLNVDEVQEFTPEEVQQMYKEKTPSEFKLVLDKLQDYHDIIRIFQSLNEAQLYTYFTGLTDAAWRQTTPTEWQSYIVYLDSQGFKGILDYMTSEEILYVWQFFDDRMTEKFISGLNMADIYGFTTDEWQAAFIGMAPTDFKRIFFDRMDVKGINYVAKQLGDMDDFLEGLTIEDWKNMTPAEWECFLMSTEIEDLVEFIHEMHEVDRKIVYDLFKFMPHDMLEDFRDAPELSHEFNRTEMETIGHAVQQNASKKESLFDDDEDFDFDTRENQHHKNRRGHHGKNGKNGKRMPNGGHGPKQHPHRDEKKGEKKHEKKQNKKQQKDRFSPNQHEQVFFDEAFAWLMDNEDFIQNDFEPYNDGLDQIREEKMQFEYENDTSDDTSDGTSDDSSSDGSSSDSSNSNSRYANSFSDSDSDDSDSESESDSDSSEMAPAGIIRKNINRKGGRDNKKNGLEKKEKHGKKDKKRRNRKNERGENEMSSDSSDSDSDSYSASDSESSIDEMFLPAMLEDVKPVDLAYIPRASIDKRHGGRHLHGKKGGKHGKKEGKHGKKGGKKGCKKGGKNDMKGEGHQGKGGRHHDGHHKGHKMVWCLAIGSIIYTALITTFLCIYKKFIKSFRSYHQTVALSQQTASMSVEERNKAYLDMTTGSRCQRKCVERQVAAPQRQEQYVPPCVLPNLDNDALTQSLIVAPQGAPVAAAPVQAPPAMAPHQATYTLEQVKELLALERARLARQ